jgi:beta-lactam-binding protein with PASTA domain
MNHRLTAAAFAAVALLGVATACKPASTTGSGGSTASATAATSASTSKTTAAKKTVPAFTGMGLQSAQDTAQAAGFYNLTSHDALGRDRNQILDRDWKVCSQNLKAGASTSTDTKLDFGAVKLKETCPAHDQAAPSAAGGVMPSFKGKSVKAARAALDSGTSITVNDASGDSRFILVESNWQVCSQTPAAGAKISGQPVTLNAVKYGETCP